MAPNRLSIASLLSSPPPQTPPPPPTTSASLPTAASSSGGSREQRADVPGGSSRDAEHAYSQSTYYRGDYPYSSQSQLPALSPSHAYQPLLPAAYHERSSTTARPYLPYDEYNLGQKRKRDDGDEFARGGEREVASRYPYSASRTSLDEPQYGPQSSSGSLPARLSPSVMSHSQAHLYSNSTSPHTHSHPYPLSVSPVDTRMSDGYFPTQSHLHAPPPPPLHIPHHSSAQPTYMPPLDYFPRPPPYAQQGYALPARTPTDRGSLSNYFPRAPSGNHIGAYVLPPPQRSPHLRSPTHLPSQPSHAPVHQPLHSAYPQSPMSIPTPRQTEPPSRIETHTLSLSPVSHYSYSTSDVRHEARAPSRERTMDRMSSGRPPSPASYSGDPTRQRTITSPYTAPRPGSGRISPLSDRRGPRSEYSARKERYDPRKDEGETVVVRDSDILAMPTLELPPAVVPEPSRPIVERPVPYSTLSDHRAGYIRHENPPARPYESSPQRRTAIPPVTLDIPSPILETLPAVTVTPIEDRPVSGQTESSPPSTITMRICPGLSTERSAYFDVREQEPQESSAVDDRARKPTSPLDQQPVSERSVSLATTVTISPRDPSPLPIPALQAPQALEEPTSVVLPERDAVQIAEAPQAVVEEAPIRSLDVVEAVPYSTVPEPSAALPSVGQYTERLPTSLERPEPVLNLYSKTDPEADPGRVVEAPEVIEEDSQMDVDVEAEPEAAAAVSVPVQAAFNDLPDNAAEDVVMVTVGDDQQVEVDNLAQANEPSAPAVSKAHTLSAILVPPNESAALQTGLKDEPPTPVLNVDTVSPIVERPPTSEPISGSEPPKIEPSVEPATPASGTHPRGKSASIELGRSESPAIGKKSKGKATKGKGKGSKATGSFAKSRSKTTAKDKDSAKPDKKGHDEGQPKSKSKGSKAKSPAVMADEEPAEDSKKTEEDEEKDDRLYCVCLTPYDEEMAMIGCDRCDNWYHPTCVGLDEDLELIDKFFCPPCVEGDPTLRTTHKKPCARSPYCTLPARLPLSKYCSDECGQAQVSEMLKRQPKAVQRLVKLTVRGAKRPEGKVDTASGRVEMRNSGEEAQLEFLEGGLRRVLEERTESEHRLEAWERRERVVEAIVGGWREEGKAKGICGYDERLGWDQSELDAAGDGAAFDICQEGTKCDRHRGWQVVHMDGVQRAKALEMENLQELTTRERALRREMEIVEAMRRDVQRVWREKPRVNGINGGDMEVIDVKIEV